MPKDIQGPDITGEIMRINCPNCGAQYEVPDEVIPENGRDVQCSNCGVTWFQAFPKAAPEPAPRADFYPAMPGETAKAEVAPEPHSEAPEPPIAPAPPRRNLDPSVTDILRQEAEHEAKLRASEQPDPLETQPELGLDHGHADPSGPSMSRRDLFPDIEEINSTLRSDGSAAGGLYDDPDAQMARAGHKSGFTSGFATVMVLAALVVLAYANAPLIVQHVPQADAPLNSLIGAIDQARFWLDAQVKSFAG